MSHSPNSASLDPAVVSLLSQAKFTSIHRDWLPERDRRLIEWLGSITVGQERRVLLLNATLGLQFYPSIVDFFILLRQAQPKIRVISASYFEEVHELGEDVARKGLEVIPVASVSRMSLAELNGFDLILAVGPSEELSRLMSLPDLTAKLVMIDLGFYHQLIRATEGRFLDRDAKNVPLVERRDAQRNQILCYTCQPERKVKDDIHAYFSLDLFAWRGFGYIPIGFNQRDYFRADRQIFDIALLGSDMRDYSQIEPEAFRGRRFLFLGAAERVPEIERPPEALDLTVISRVDENVYGKLLALCRCVVLPMIQTTDNVLLSVVDALGSCKPLITQRRPGLERLEAEGAPIILFADRPGSLPGSDLPSQVNALLGDESRQRKIGEQTAAFARAHLDMYAILARILLEQLL